MVENLRLDVQESDIPAALKGSLFATEITPGVIELYEELLENGHYLGLSRTTQPDREVFFRAGRREVVGAAAIRHHVNVGD